MNKITKKTRTERGIQSTILILLILCMAQITLVSSFDFDNVKDYNSETKTATITNALGLGDKIADITLITPQINYVVDEGKGIKQLVAETEFNNFQNDYSNAMKSMNFINNKNQVEINRAFEYRYRTITKETPIPIYETECSDGKTLENGSIENICTENIVDYKTAFEYSGWKTFTQLFELPSGKVRVGIFTDVVEGDNVEWIPTWFGIEIEEWATWTSELNVGLIAYYPFEEGTGTTTEEVTGNTEVNNGNLIDNVTWGAGKIGNGTIYGGGSSSYVEVNDSSIFDNLEMSVNVWFKTSNTGVYNSIFSTPGGVNQSRLTLSHSGPKISIFAGGQVFAELTPTWHDTNWHMATLTYKSGDSHLYIDGGVYTYNYTETFTTKNSTPLFIGNSGGNFGSFVGIIDEFGIWNRTLTGAEITQLYNSGDGITYFSAAGLTTAISVNLSSPADEITFSNATMDFDSLIIPMNANITNATLLIWHGNHSIFNETTNIIVGNETNTSSWTIGNFTIGNYIWNVYGCGLNLSSDTICAYDETNRTFAWQPFSITSTSFPTDTLETSTESFQANISASPTVSSLSGYFWYNGTRYSAVVNDLGSGDYYTTPNTIDIPLQESSGNKTFKWEFLFTLTDSSTANSNSSTYSHFVNSTHLSICNATYTIPYINFTLRNAENPFPLVNGSFKSAWEWWLGSGSLTRNMSYEDVSETSSNWSFCMSPTDQTYNVNSHIETDETLYSQNNYFLTNASLSNSTTEIDLYLLNDSVATLTVFRVLDKSQKAQENVTLQIQLYDVGTDTFYTIAMAQTAFNGEDIAYLNWYDSLYKIILIRDGLVIKTINPYRITESPQIITLEGDDTFIHDKFTQMAYDMFYNNVTQNFVLTFTKPSGEVELGCLRVIKRDGVSDSEICNVCETSSSATLYCNVGGYGNGTYIASFYATGSYWNFGSIIENIGGDFAETIYNLLGNDDATFYAFMFSGMIVALMFVSLPLGILGMILGILGSSALGFQILDWGAFLGVIIVGGTMIWFIKK